MIRLLNSAMMPTEGVYRLSKINKEEFVTILQKAVNENQLESYIGYPQNIELLKQWSGLDIPLNRKETVVEDGDTLLIMKLNYRPEAGSKGLDVNDSSFLFYRAEFSRE